MGDPTPSFATSCTPLRISFAGGGTDLPEHYENSANGGAVFSAAIDQPLFVTVKHLSAIFEEKYRLNYSISERVNPSQNLTPSMMQRPRSLTLC